MHKHGSDWDFPNENGPIIWILNSYHKQWIFKWYLNYSRRMNNVGGRLKALVKNASRHLFVTTPSGQYQKCLCVRHTAGNCLPFLCCLLELPFLAGSISLLLPYVSFIAFLTREVTVLDHLLAFTSLLLIEFGRNSLLTWESQLYL